MFEFSIVSAEGAPYTSLGRKAQVPSSIFRFSAASTPVRVSSVGFPFSERDRYSVSRCSPDSSATFDMRFACATLPSADRKTAGASWRDALRKAAAISGSVSFSGCHSR